LVNVQTTGHNAVTGDGTTYTVVFDSVTVDRNGDFSSSTTFTAPDHAFYNFSGVLKLSGYAVDNTTTTIALSGTFGGYTLYSNTYNTVAGNPASNGTIFLPFAINNVEILAGATATVILTVSGHATKNINVLSANSVFTVTTQN